MTSQAQKQLVRDQKNKKKTKSMSKCRLQEQKTTSENCKFDSNKKH